jgi:hypothetical protein
MRNLDHREHALLDRLLLECTFDTMSLSEQANVALVRNLNPDETILRIEFPEPVQKAPAPLLHYIPVEASAKDIDGITLHVLLHIRGGQLYELEYVKEGLAPLLQKPTADDLFNFVVTP